ncbi:MAG: sulfotransferase [Steroidobacteraceae bacterium]
MKSFDADEILETARRRTGLADFGPGDFLEPFRVFVTSLNTTAAIAPDRFDRMYERLQRLLINRLWFAKDVAEHPEINDEDVGAPIVISTLPRTGSTKLHRLLAAGGDFQYLTFWKAHMPSRIPGEPDGGVQRRVAETREHEAWMYATSPDMRVGHPMYTDEAEEDQWLMEQSFRHPLLAGAWEAPLYMQWLMQADTRLTFDYFLGQLKYLQWQTPASERNKPWLIKSPTHFGYEHQLQRIFRAMKVVVSHRDPGKSISSISSTTKAARKMYSDQHTGAVMATHLNDMFSHVATEHVRWRDANPQVPALDLAFREVSADGLAAARKVYHFLGMPMSAAAAARMRDWEQRNGLEKHGRAVYSAEEYGTTEADIRAAFAAYIERFSRFL